jgi:hypothetical protein
MLVGGSSNASRSNMGPFGGGYNVGPFGRQLGNSDIRDATGSTDDFLIINPEELLTYTFPERLATKLCRATETGSAGGSTGKFHIPDIRMSFLSETGEVLRKEIIKYKSNHTQQSSFSYILGVGRSSTGLPTLPSTSMLLTSLKKDRPGVKCMIFIDTVSRYSILTKVSEDILANTGKIVLSYLKSNKASMKNPFGVVGLNNDNIQNLGPFKNLGPFQGGNNWLNNTDFGPSKNLGPFQNLSPF